MFCVVLQTLDFDRDGLIKVKKAIKSIYTSGNGNQTVVDFVPSFKLQNYSTR